MDPQLEAYKKRTIDELVITFNSVVSSLRSQLISKINTIQNFKLSVKIKMNNILFIQKKYNSDIDSLKRKLALDIKNINLLNVLPQRSTPDKFAVLVGINYKNTHNELYGCINDTKNIQTLLQTKYGFNNFIFLTDETNKKPTKQNILTALTNLLVNSISGDSLFFLYSGHGTCTTDLNGDEADGQDELIVPIDAININSCILDDELNLIIKNNLKPGVKLFTLFDSCFSGTVLDLKYNFDKLDTMISNPNTNDTVGQVIMVSGCKDYQTSADAFINNKSTGAMTFSFIKTIEQYGTSITLKQLVENMRTLLNNNGFEQIPQLSTGTSININTYLLQF